MHFFGKARHSIAPISSVVDATDGSHSNYSGQDFFWRAQDAPISSIRNARDGSHLNYCSRYRDKEWIRYDDYEMRMILDQLLVNKRVESLVLDENPFEFPGSWEALGQLFRISTTLTAVSLQGKMDEHGLKCIVDGILQSTECALECLCLSTRGLKNADIYTMHLTRLLQHSLTLKRIFLDKDLFAESGSLPPEAMKRIAEAVVFNTTLLELHVRFPLADYICKALTPAEQCSPAQSGYNNTLKRLYISGCVQRCGLQCAHCHVPSFLKVLLRMLQSDNSLEELYIEDCFWDQEYWIQVFDSLRSNKILLKLSLSNCKDIGVGEAFNCLVGLLQVNFRVEIELDELTLMFMDMKPGSVQEEEIKALLKQNRKMAKYMHYFDNLEFLQPKLGRLYLCGAPQAGKTTLRRRMLDSRAPLARLKAKSARLIKARGHDGRTQGIEIRTLQGHQEERIAIWDMAGQEEYRALHDSHYLFPEINQGCLFLFVFGGIDISTGKFDPQLALDRLKRELCYWLTFVNSNLGRARMRIPQISVVLTHLDKVIDWFPSAEKYVQWARDAIKEMRDSFSGRIEIHQTVYAVDSLSGRGVPELVDHIRTSFGDLFTKLPKIPDICQKLSLVLAEWNLRHKSEPVLTSRRFLELCQQTPELSDALDVLDSRPLPESAETISAEATETISAEATDKILKRWHAIVSYLNDVGWIVKFEKLDCIVVDVNWLGRDFLGMLFHSDNLRAHLAPSKQGIIDVHRLELFFEKFIARRKYKGIQAGTLIQLMKELKICEDTSLSQPGSSSSSSQLFMPSTLEDDQGRAHEGTRRLRWTEIRGDSEGIPVYAGFRLLCEDSTRTFLSPGLFLRYQVHLLRKLSEVDRNFDYELERDLIRVKHDGTEMFIESSGEPQNADYVDVLIRIVDQSERRKQYAYEKGILELQRFCGSGEGCPGVTLQEHILRPECVEKLVLCKNRKNQAVSREDLTKMVVEKLQQSMGETQESWTEGIYKHRFEAVEDSEDSLPEAWVDTSKLLSLTDFHTIRIMCEQSRIEVIERIDGAVKDLERETNSSISLRPEASTSSIVSARVSDAEQGKSPVFLGPSDDDQQRDLPIGMRDLSRQLDSAIKTLHSMVINQDQHHEQTLREIRNCGNLFMNTFQEEVLMQRIYRVSQLEHTLPKLLYFTDFDPTFSERVISCIKLGSALRLHFLCEEPHQMHFVKGQEGLPITKEFQGKMNKKLRPLVLASAKMMYIVIKAGIHVGAGVGNVIPDIGVMDLSPSFLFAETLISEIKTSDHNQSDLDFKYAWDCLVEEIIGPMREKIPQVFGLYKVVYKASVLEKRQPTSAHWICRECRERALRAGWLDMQNEIKFQGFLPKSKMKGVQF